MSKILNRYFALALIGSINIMQGQVYLNIVNNPSFEDTIPCPIYDYGRDTIGCPREANQLCKSKYWFNPYPYCGSSPDYFNSCSNTFTYTFTNVGVPKNGGGYQQARTGNAYAGIGAYLNFTFTPHYDFCEYIKNSLKENLKQNTLYCVTFYVSSANDAKFSINHLGYYFSTDSLYLPAPNCWAIPMPDLIIDTVPCYEETVVITDTLNWVQVQGMCLAKGGENKLTIGRFTPASNSSVICLRMPCYTSFGTDDPYAYAYYYIDDVSVIEADSAKAGVQKSYAICPGESVVLGTDTTEGANYVWHPATALSCTNCAHPIASPTVTTTYYLEKTQCKLVTTDSVKIIVKDKSYFSIPDSGSICLGDTFYVHLNTDTSLHYYWYPIQDITCSNCNDVGFYPSSSSSYILQTKYCNRTDYDTLDIKVNTLTVTVTPQLYTISVGDTIHIQASGASNYLWIPATGLNNPNVANPIFSPTTTTEYCVIGSESSNTCSDSVCIKIQVEGTCSNIRIPNVFTPNNDNINDTWGIEFPCPQAVGNFHLLIFNRWGVKLYEADKPNAKWDGLSLSGEPVPTGTYYYVAEFIINPAQGGKKQEAKGYFTLMR